MSSRVKETYSLQTGATCVHILIETRAAHPVHVVLVSDVH